MEDRKKLTLPLGIIAVILGWTLFKQFDFEQLKFKHTGLAFVYLVALVCALYVIRMNYRGRPGK